MFLFSLSVRALLCCFKITSFDLAFLKSSRLEKSSRLWLLLLPDECLDTPPLLLPTAALGESSKDDVADE
jgi:hypothetical protein